MLITLDNIQITYCKLTTFYFCLCNKLKKLTVMKTKKQSKQVKQLKELDQKEMKAISGGAYTIYIDKNGNMKIVQN